MFIFLIRPDIKGGQIEESTGSFDDAWRYVVAAMHRRPRCRRYFIEKLELYGGSPTLYRIAERLPSGEIAGLLPEVEQRVLALTS
jgi:hypothetical protein